MITIVATTYFPAGMAGLPRLEVAKQAISSWQEHLVVRDGEEVALVLADDASAAGCWASLAAWAADEWNCGPLTKSRAVRAGGVGASLNRGIALAPSDVILYAVDDWRLTAPLDLQPWVNLLREDESMGMIRLGPPHPFTAGRVEMNPYGWHLRLDPSQGGFVFGHRPALYHRRFFDDVGPFEEGVSALECERLFNERYCWEEEAYRDQVDCHPIPGIVLALPHPWEHIESVELSAIDPRGRS